MCIESGKSHFETECFIGTIEANVTSAELNSIYISFLPVMRSIMQRNKEQLCVAHIV